MNFSGPPLVDRTRYEKDGFLHLPSVLGEKEASLIREGIKEIFRLEKEKKSGQEPFERSNKYRRFTLHLHLKIPKIREYFLHPVFEEIGRALLGEDVDLFFTSTMAKIEGKNAGVEMHQDIIYDPKRCLDRLLCWTSITPSHPGNGGLFVVPGSHKQGILTHEPSREYEREFKTAGYDLADAIPMRMEAGDILALHPLLVHGSPENQSPGDRIALMAGFQKPGLYTEAELPLRMEILRNGVRAQAVG